MNGTNYEVPHCGAFSTPHSHLSWAKIFASEPCFQTLDTLADVYITNKTRDNISEAVRLVYVKVFTTNRVFVRNFHVQQHLSGDRCCDLEFQSVKDAPSKLPVGHGAVTCIQMERIQ